jgi:hypothetical protein
MNSGKMVGPDALPTPLTPLEVERRIPAWLMSLALHLAALLLGTLLVRGTYLPAARHEPERPTSIVLARAGANATPQYYSDEEVPADSAETSAANQATETTANEDSAASGSAPPAAGIELPGASAATTNPGALVIRPSLTTGRGTPKLGGLSDADVAAILAEEAGRPRNVAPTGPTAKLSLFGSAQAEGRSFVFLIDRSQSMGHQGLGAIAAAAKELAASIDALGPEQRLQVIAYNQKPLALGGWEMLPATPENKRKLIEFVANTAAFGATEHELGLFAALRHKPEVVFLFTDGGDPELKPGQLRSIREAAAGRTAIHCLHFGSGPPAEDENFLRRLAEQTGGSYVYIDMRK